MKKRIYSLLEVKSRELHGKILFSIQMANKGYSVVIGKKRSLYENAKFFQKGVFLFKGMGPKNIKPMQKLKELGHKIVGFDEEGLVMNMRDIMPLRVNKTCFNLVEYFFTVGNFQKQRTLKCYPNKHKKIVSTGNLRFDLMKKPLKSLYNDSVEEIKKKYGKFIFFPTKFTILNNFEAEKKHFIKVINQKNTKGPSYKKSYKVDFDEQTKIQNKLHKFFNYFPKKYPDIKILIKKHPAERKEYWLDLVKRINCKNLIIADDKYPTNAYILAAEFNVGSNCHTSLESYLFSKPTINWLPDKKESYLTYQAIKAVSKEILNYKELEKICNEWFLKNKKFKNKITVEKKKILNNQIENINKYSANIQKKYFDKIVLDDKGSHDKYSNTIYLFLLDSLRKLKNIYYSFKADKKSKEYYRQKFEGLDLKEYSFLIKKFCKLMNLNYNDYVIKELYPGCYNIEKK